MDVIASRQNAVVKRFRAVARAAAADSGEALLDGEHLLVEALGARVPVDIAAFSAGHLNGSARLTELAARVTAAGGRVVRVPEDIFAAMSPVRHPSGVVAIARMQAAPLASVFRAGAAPPLALVLAGVQDPGNVGAIIRSAAAFGATAVVATEGCANPYGWKALRGAMGGTFRVPVVPFAAIDDVIAAARTEPVRLVATVPRGGTPLPGAALAGACAIVVGGEGAGLPQAVIAAASERVTIPMRAPVESLNVAIAAALVLYEASRQRAERA